MTERVPREFFSRSGVDVAPDLLGMCLTHTTADGAVTLRITEVEAYQGESDPGSHAFRGPTVRNNVMFAEPGHLYTYRHLGLHTCMNLVCGPVDTAAAVLLRAGEIVAGQELARRRRRNAGVVKTDLDLARGPARLTVALGIDMTLLGADLYAPESSLSLSGVPSLSRTAISSGPRVGVSGQGGDGERFPWRYWLTDDPAVSAYRRAAPRRPRQGRM